MKKIFLILTFLLSWSICLAEIPHVLKNGDIVDADQLNENFEYNKIEINELSDEISELKLDVSNITADINELSNEISEISSDNTSSSTDIRFVYANGNIIGTTDIVSYAYSNMDLASYNFLKFNEDFHKVPFLNYGGKIRNYIFSGNGYIFTNEFNFRFKLSDCQGDAYFLFGLSNSGRFIFPLTKGRIFDHQNSIYYYPKNANIYKFISQSYLASDGSCNNGIGMSNYLYVKLLPNNPTVTGIQTYPFPLPITFDGINEAVIIQE